MKLLCRVLEVSRCGFYAWLKRPPCWRDQKDERLRVAIRATHHKTRRTYSAKRLKTELEAEGVIAGRDRIGRLRREEGIRCIQKQTFKATTYSNHSLPVADNLLNRSLNQPHRMTCGSATSPTSRPMKAGCTSRASRTYSPARLSVTPWDRA